MGRRPSPTGASSAVPRTAAALLDPATELPDLADPGRHLGRDGPLSPERLLDYLTKATREAKRHTTLDGAGQGLRGTRCESFAAGSWPTRRCWPPSARSCRDRRRRPRVAVLGQKFVQLAMPGVPDVYQGMRAGRPVPGRPGQPPRRSTSPSARERLAALDAGEAPGRPGRREAAGRLADAAAAPGAPGGVHRPGRGVLAGALDQRQRGRVRPRARWRPRGSWPSRPGCRCRWNATAGGASTPWRCRTAPGATRSPAAEVPGGATGSPTAGGLPVALLLRA